MVIGVLQFEVLIPGSESLKDKRRVVHSLRDRLHRDHLVSVAEVGMQNRRDAAVMAVVCAAPDGARAGEVLDRISARLRSMHEARLGDISREIIHGSSLDLRPDETAPSGAAIALEMLARAEGRAS